MERLTKVLTAISQSALTISALAETRRQETLVTMSQRRRVAGPFKGTKTYGRAPGQGDDEALGLKLKLGTPPSVPAVPPSDPTNSKSLAMIIKKSLAVSQPYD